MSKIELKKYLNELTKEQIEVQILDLYQKFPAIKEFYNFVFNPNEGKLLSEAKVKISQEYYPVSKTFKRKKPKLRRSVAQNIIKHFILLGVDHVVVAEIMLYNIEIAQTYASENNILAVAFYKSILNSFNQLIQYLISSGITIEFSERVEKIEISMDKIRNEI
jgi:hypothetical protein